jgi:metal-responsive CopG/Arc/MetJ family transcriptional regulator
MNIFNPLSIEGLVVAQNSAISNNEINRLKQKIAKLETENEELKLLLSGAHIITNKIATLVGDRGQYRDLVEAVEMKLHALQHNNE